MRELTYLGKTLQFRDFGTVDVVRMYLIECSDCGPIDEDDGTMIETRAAALKVQREHHAYHNFAMEALLPSE